ncbi:uncharacterized protein UV8b_03987 [Ustilaginoidea virens]|uniref:GRF-type domain-containing protein n=1 Tax=Ustilaginoidea virens TaxID=1159556 RepID=A0A1B5KSD0_USTVR|nr:uncharacterized protein UV8b_03987 [Ustilaginoidea virens]QUC19746.1 hypothetical protein UV8b_03987 [Ustilaginoidea virens]GAO13783.1 hypothetical protein UVI_02004940 [Ustilaginoidea virens]
MPVSTPPKRQVPASTWATPAHAALRQPPASLKRRLNGIWDDGTWWCNCEPRSRAVRRESKKNNRNKGRLYWTCAYSSCKFFLWEEEAAVREPAASRGHDHDGHGHGLGDDEPEPLRPKTPTFTQRPLESYGILKTLTRRGSATKRSGGNMAFESSASATTASFSSGLTVRNEPSRTSAAQPDTPGTKRKRHQRQTSSYGEFSDLDSDEERQLARLADRGARPTTPRAATATRDVFTTPATETRAIDVIGGLPTPSVSRILFPPSEAPRFKTVSFEEPLSTEAVVTPTKAPPSSHAHANAVSPPISPCNAVQDLTSLVMDLLRDQPVDRGVAGSLRKALDAWGRKTAGIAKGRDAARAAAKQKQARISELEETVRALQGKLKYQEEKMTETKRKIQDAYDVI